MKGAVSEEELKQFDELYRRFAGMNGRGAEVMEGLPGIDVSIVEIVSLRPDISVGEIAQAIGMPNSTLTSALNRLEKRGVVRRVTNRLDRRSLGIRLTNSGEKLHRTYVTKFQANYERLLAKLDTHEERELLFYLLDKMVGPGRDAEDNAD